MVAYPGVDLHAHTTYSDGADTPFQLVAKAAELGIWHLAITDHDSIEALPEAVEAGRQYGVEIMSGIELTVQYEDYQDVHILGYGFDPANLALKACLDRMQERRVARGLEILRCVNRRLSDSGMAPLNRERVLARAQGALARPHLAHELMDQGYVETFQEAFSDYLVPCDAPKATLSPEEAFSMVREAGGVGSLAHPGTLSTTPNEIDRLLSAFKTMGMAGIEAYHHCHYSDFIQYLCGRAKHYDLVVTGGSDYHGRPNGASLGFIGTHKPVPDEVLANVVDAQARIKGTP